MPSVSEDVKKRSGRGKDALAAAIIERFNQAREPKRPWEKQAYKNIAFLLGNQWHDWVDGTGLIEMADASGDRYHLVHNLIEQHVTIAVARMTSHRPWMQALPATMDQEDMDAARLATKLLHYWRRKLFAQSLTIDHCYWNVVAGTAFWRVGWDSYAGRSIVPRPLGPASEGILSPHSAAAEDAKAPRGGRSEFERLVEQVVEAEVSGVGDNRLPGYPEASRLELIAEGDVLLENLNPFEVFPEPYCNDWERMNWVIHARRRSRPDIEQIWGKRVAQKSVLIGQHAADNVGFDPEKIPKGGDPYNLDSVFGGQPYHSEEDVLILEYWERASEKHPKGRRVLVIGGNVVEDGDNPFPFNDFPIVPTFYHRVPGAFWGRGLVEGLMPMQEEYNRTLSQLAEARDYFSFPKILMPRGAQISENVGSNVPGEIWEYNGGIPPTVLNAGQMPAFLGTTLQHSRQSMMDVAFQHEITQGTTPPNVEYGVAIQLLHEADNSPMRITYDMYDDAITKIGLMLLQIGQKYYTEERAIRLVGEGKAPQVIAFTGADLRGIVDVRVEARSAIPDTLSARRQEAMNLYNLGIFGPPGDPATSRRFLKYYEMGQVAELFEEEETLDEMLLGILRRAMQGDQNAAAQLLQLTGILQSIGGPPSGAAGSAPQPQGAGTPGMGIVTTPGSVIPGNAPVGMAV